MNGKNCWVGRLVGDGGHGEIKFDNGNFPNKILLSKKFFSYKLLTKKSRICSPLDKTLISSCSLRANLVYAQLVLWVGGAANKRDRDTWEPFLFNILHNYTVLLQLYSCSSDVWSGSRKLGMSSKGFSLFIRFISRTRSTCRKNILLVIFNVSIVRAGGLGQECGT